MSAASMERVAGLSSADGLPMKPWTMMFEDPMVEEAYTKSRHPSMLLNLSRMSLIVALGILTTFVSPLMNLLLGSFTGCSGGADMSEMANRSVLLLVGLIGAVVFRCPGAEQRFSFRACEAYVTCFCLVVLLIPIWYMRPDAHVLLTQSTFSEKATCFYYAETNARTALVMDCLVTMTHLMLPIRWCVMIWMDLICVFVFAMQRWVLLGSQGDFSTLVAFTSLVIAASLGLHFAEFNQRLNFATISKEREMRYKAEFKAELGRMQLPVQGDPERRGREEQLSVAPSTTVTGKVFEGLGQSADSQAKFMDTLMQLGTQEQWLLKPDEVDVKDEKILGHGGFGVVVEGSFNGITVAVKHYTRSKSKVGDQWQPVLDSSSVNELRILRHVRHPHIVLFHGALISQDTFDVSLVFEKVSGLRFDRFIASMHEWKQSVAGASITWHQCALMRGVSAGLMYLHSRPTCVVHADVKPGNIIVQQHNSRPFPKLLDFGLSRIATRGAKIRGGTPSYMAPEVLAKTAGRATAAVDVYAFGQLLFYVASGRHPRPSHNKAGEQLWTRGPNILMRWKPIIESCRIREPAVRPTMRMVGEMLFGGDGDGDSDGEGNANWQFDFDGRGPQVPEQEGAQVLGHVGQQRTEVARGLLDVLRLHNNQGTWSEATSLQTPASAGTQWRAGNWGLSL